MKNLNLENELVSNDLGHSLKYAADFSCYNTLVKLNLELRKMYFCYQWWSHMQTTLFATLSILKKWDSESILYVPEVLNVHINENKKIYFS